jgi:hypothetical protein
MTGAREAEKLKVFVSYSRRDATAADALVAALTARGFEVAIDRRDLPFGEKWQAELAEFIRLSDTVIWLVSDASIQSNWVNWELDEVARRNKRLVPVMVAETARDRLPRQLGEIHILPAEGVIDLVRDLDTLVRVLETDRAWIKQAARLQDRAAEWLSKGRTSALLLSRGALADAEKWKEHRPAKSPAPAQEVLDLLHASRQSATRRQRWWVGGSLVVAIGALALAGFAYLQSVEAQRQANAAQRQEKIAGEQRDVAEGRRRETSRGLGLNDLLCKHASFVDSLDELLDVARTINQDYPTPIEDDDEVVKRTQAVWEDLQAGKLTRWLGREGNAHASKSEIKDLSQEKNGGDALMLLMLLRSEHTARVRRGETFALNCRALADCQSLSWTEDRFRNARDVLLRCGHIKVVCPVRHRRRGRTAAQYTLVLEREI